MIVVLKSILALFILTGIAISSYGCRELLRTWIFVRDAPQRSTGTFIGYVRHEVASRSSSPSATDWGRQDFTDSISYMSYPEFEVNLEGREIRVLGDKQHLLERFKPGQQVEVLVPPLGSPRRPIFIPSTASTSAFSLWGFLSYWYRSLSGKVRSPLSRLRQELQ